MHTTISFSSPAGRRRWETPSDGAGLNVTIRLTDPRSSMTLDVLEFDLSLSVILMLFNAV